ncbi:MAG: hypothetical protein RRA32_01395 [bacterium]|nr:hypothetical protein [bacterium]
MGLARQAIGLDLHGDDEVQADHAQVGKVFPGEAAGFKMGVDEAKAPEVSGGKAIETKVGDENAAAVADEDVGDLAPPVHEEPELPVGLPGQLRQPPDRLGRYDLSCSRFGPAQALDALYLVAPQAGGLAFDLCYGFLPAPSSWRGW